MAKLGKLTNLRFSVSDGGLLKRRWPAAALGAVALSLSLAACGGAPSQVNLTPVPLSVPVAGAKIADVMVATNRRYEPETDHYGSGRTRKLSFEEFKISVPPNHKSGEIEWPDNPPGDPKKDFVTLERQRHDEASFRKRLSARAKSSQNEAFIFVHGFNTVYQEAIYRSAQIDVDSDYKGIQIVYSWPSEGSVSGYVRDRESVNFTRDTLERFVRMVASTPGIKKVHILAHSMGNQLTMEMLRTAALKGDRNFGGKLGFVVLASPDIDSQVFVTQLDAVGKREPPMVIFINKNDRALSASSTLAGDIARVGDIDPNDPVVQANIKKYGLVVLDTTDISAPDALNHSSFASRAILHGFRQHLNQISRSGPEAVGHGVLSATGGLLTAPGRMLTGGVGSVLGGTGVPVPNTLGAE